MRIIVKVIMGLYLCVATLNGAVLTEYSNVNKDSTIDLASVSNTGQSFTLSSSATVTDIVLYEGVNTGNGSEFIGLYSSANCTGGTLTSCKITWNNSTDSAMTCNLSVPQTLSAGTYSFCQTTNDPINNFEVRIDSISSSYTGGDLIVANSAIGGSDLTFQVLGTVTAGPGGSSANAPFTPLVLGLLFGSLGLVGFFGRRFVK